MVKNLKFLFSLEQITLILLGSKQGRKTESKFGNKLRELKKIRLFYGKLPLKYLQKLIRKSGSFPPHTRNETIFTILESRLDVILYRSTFFESIATAKQWIFTRGVYVNKKKVFSPATIIISGDIISIFETGECVDVKASHTISKTSLPNHFALHSKKKYLVRLEETFYKRDPSFSQLSLKVPLTQNTQPSIFPTQKKKIQEINSKALQLLKKKTRNWRFKASPFKLTFLRSCLKLSSNLSKETSVLKKRWINLYCSKSQKLFLSKQYWDSIRKSWPFLLGNEISEPKIVQLETSPSFSFKTTLSKQSFDTPFSKSNSTTRLAESESKQCFIKNPITTTDFVSDPFKSKEVIKKVDKSDPTVEKKAISHSTSTQLTRKEIQDSRIDNFLFQNYKQFLKKQWISSTKKKRKLRKRKNDFFDSNHTDIQGKRIFDSNDGIVYSEHSESKKRKTRAFHFKFLPSYLFKVKKEKANCFFKQKSSDFFKEQFFFASKRLKPLHLEISYKNISIIFLFSPQRVYFPFFINVSQIYK